MLSNIKILLIGNFLTSNGKTCSVSEEFLTRINADKIIYASSLNNRIIRGLHMIIISLLFYRKYDVSIIDVFSGKAFLWAESVSWFCSLLKKPFILTLRGGNLPEYAKKHPKRVKSILCRATYITSPSLYLYKRMYHFSSNIVLLPNPIDIENYIFKVRKKIQPNLVWLRSFHSIYNPSLASRTLSLLIKEFPEIRLTMYGPDKGDGSYQECREISKSLNVDTFIEMPGKIEKKSVPQKLKSNDIFINTTNVDNTPVSVIEAMACGLCIVSTNVGGIPYLLEHKKDALLVPPNDPKAMADAIRCILNDPELASNISRNAREKAEQFDWNNILPKWHKLILSTVKKSS